MYKTTALCLALGNRPRMNKDTAKLN